MKVGAKVKREPGVKKEKQCKKRRVGFPVVLNNKQQHGVTDLSDDETPVSGHPRQEDTKKVMKKEQQEPSQMPKPPSLAEMFRVVTWPQDIFENKEEYGIEELAEEKGLEWHELSCSLRHFYEERSAMQVCALIVFMMKGQGGTLQEFELLDREQKNSYYSDADLGICGMSPSKPDLAYLSCLDPGWMPWRLNSFEQMKKAGGEREREPAGETAEGAGEEGHPKQEDTKKDMEKEQQEPSQKLKPPSPTEMFQVVEWPQQIFEHRDFLNTEYLEWHELSGQQRKLYEERSAMGVCALMNFMMTGQGGTVQEFALLDAEQAFPYYSDRALGICEMSSETDLDYLSRLDPGWMPWRTNSLEKMTAGG